MPVHLTSTVSRIVGLLPGKGRTNPVPPSIRFDTAIGEGLTPAGASRDQRLALVRRHPLLRCDRHQTKLIPVGLSSPSRVSQSLEEIDAPLPPGTELRSCATRASRYACSLARAA